MQIFQTHRFQKQIKKLHPQMKSILDQAVKAVFDNPLIGEAKIDDLTLMSFGSHENFYRDLKKAL